MLIRKYNGFIDPTLSIAFHLMVIWRVMHRFAKHYFSLSAFNSSTILTSAMTFLKSWIWLSMSFLMTSGHPSWFAGLLRIGLYT